MAALKVLPLKFCAVCHALMVRHRSAAGRLESFADFRARKFCGHACKGRALTGGLFEGAARGLCIQCGSPLRRKRRPCGELELRRDFRKRRWCDRVCRVLWFGDDSTRITARGDAHSQATKRGLKFLARVTRSVPRSASRTARLLTCIHGSATVDDCEPCVRLRRERGMSDRSLLRPVSAWVALGVWDREALAVFLAVTVAQGHLDIAP